MSASNYQDADDEVVPIEDEDKVVEADDVPEADDDEVECDAEDDAASAWTEEELMMGHGLADIAGVLSDALLDPEPTGQSACTALLEIAHQLTMTNKILVKMLAKM